MQIVLASSSPYRRNLLSRLGVNFEVVAPKINEAPRPGETAEVLAARLASEKAAAVADQFDYALIIASDQVAAFGDSIISKSGSVPAAREQLTKFSGQSVTFYTSLCLLNQSTGRQQEAVVPFEVTFRELNEAQIADYVDRDQPMDCAGSFKWESLGIALFAGMHGTDVTALEGLPLMTLVTMLENEGMPVLRNR